MGLSVKRWQQQIIGVCSPSS